MHPVDSDDMVPFHNSVQAGESFLQSIYEAWKHSPERDDILLLITFDEHGGTYDHVSPPKDVGIRVPTILISTHLDQKFLSTHTCSEKLQHISVLKTIHKWLNLSPLTDLEAQWSVLPDSLFTSDLTLSQDQLPDVKCFETKVKEEDEKLIHFPLRTSLARHITGHYLFLCKECNVHQVSRDMMKGLREKNNHFSHLYAKREEKRNTCWQWIRSLLGF